MRFPSLKGSRRSSGGSPSGAWTKSSLSMYNGNCVEVAGLDGGVILMRDSKHPRRRPLALTPQQWDDFIGGIQQGELARPGR
jgi:hypothetical protein